VTERTAPAHTAVRDSQYASPYPIMHLQHVPYRQLCHILCVQDITYSCSNIILNVCGEIKSTGGNTKENFKMFLFIGPCLCERFFFWLEKLSYLP